MPFGGALVASSLIGAGGSLFGGLSSGKAAKQAANIQAANAQKVAGMATNAAGAAAGNEDTALNNAQSWIANATDYAGGLVSQGTAGANSILAGAQNTALSGISPFLTAGTQGVNELASALAPGGALTQQFAPPNPQDISNTPEYQFQLQQGLQALQRSAAATGNLEGGGTEKAIAQYSEGLASTSYQQAYNNALSTFQTNHNNLLNGYSALAGFGPQANQQQISALSAFASPQASNVLNNALYGANTGINAAEYAGNAGLQTQTTIGNQGIQAAQIAGNALTGGANAQAAGVVGQANAYNTALGGITNSVSSGLLLNGLYGAGGPYGPTSSTTASAPLWGGLPSVTTGPNYPTTIGTTPPFIAPQVAPGGAPYMSIYPIGGVG